jgi:hypothetical protein
LFHYVSRSGKLFHYFSRAVAPLKNNFLAALNFCAKGVLDAQSSLYSFFPCSLVPFFRYAAMATAVGFIVLILAGVLPRIPG